MFCWWSFASSLARAVELMHFEAQMKLHIVSGFQIYTSVSLQGGPAYRSPHGSLCTVIDRWLVWTEEQNEIELSAYKQALLLPRRGLKLDSGELWLAVQLTSLKLHRRSQKRLQTLLNEVISAKYEDILLVWMSASPRPTTLLLLALSLLICIYLLLLLWLAVSPWQVILWWNKALHFAGV